LYNNTHSTFGTVIFALVLVQPILGLVHHFQYQVQQQSTFAGLVHKWYGRVLIILAVVNGGLGLKLAGDTSGGPTIAYSVVSAVVFVVYIGVVALTVLRSKKGEKY
jgi:FtsH-binding integral membrane protein